LFIYLLNILIKPNIYPSSSPFSFLSFFFFTFTFFSQLNSIFLPFVNLTFQNQSPSMQLIPFPTHCPPTPRTCNHKQFMPQPSSSSSSSSTTNAVPPPPPDLRTVLSGKTARFKQTYTNFWAIPGAKADVEAYRADREHVYKVLYVYLL